MTKRRHPEMRKNPLETMVNMRTIQAIYLGGKKFE
jgi:hypothetical protein